MNNPLFSQSISLLYVIQFLKQSNNFYPFSSYPVETNHMLCT